MASQGYLHVGKGAPRSGEAAKGQPGNLRRAGCHPDLASEEVQDVCFPGTATCVASIWGRDSVLGKMRDWGEGVSLPSSTSVQSQNLPCRDLSLQHEREFSDLRLLVSCRFCCRTVL